MLAGAVRFSKETQFRARLFAVSLEWCASSIVWYKGSSAFVAFLLITLLTLLLLPSFLLLMVDVGDIVL